MRGHGLRRRPVGLRRQRREAAHGLAAAEHPKVIGRCRQGLSQQGLSCGVEAGRQASVGGHEIDPRALPGQGAGQPVAPVFTTHDQHLPALPGLARQALPERLGIELRGISRRLFDPRHARGPQRGRGARAGGPCGQQPGPDSARRARREEVLDGIGAHEHHQRPLRQAAPRRMDRLHVKGRRDADQRQGLGLHAALPQGFDPGVRLRGRPGDDDAHGGASPVDGPRPPQAAGR